MSRTEKLKYPGLVTPYNAQHIGSREEQQDYFAYSNMFDEEERRRCGIVAVLADGMGGLKNGRQASHTGTNVFMNTYLCSNIVDIRERMIDAAIAANDAVKQIAGAGSTLVAVVVMNWNLYWLSIGDSRLYLYRNYKLTQLNKEHNYAAALDVMVNDGVISRQEAMSDPNRAALTSYLGVDELELIDINMEELPLRCGDSLLLCSDGLYNTLKDKEIAAIITDADDDVCDLIVEKALSKGLIHQDNITVMLMDID